MTDAPALAITSATGAIGRLAAEELAREGMPLRLLARSPERAPQLPRAVVLQSGGGDLERSRASLEGVSTLLMVSASESDDWSAQQLDLVRVAAEAGVEHVVYTSVQSAAADATFAYAREHFAAEEAIRASGMAWTILRDGVYLDSLMLLPDAGGVIRAPARAGRVAGIAKVDVARSAAAVLRDPAAHAGRTFELTGPEALSFTEIAATLSSATGRRIRYRDETLDEAHRPRAPFGVPARRVEAWVSTYAAIAEGCFSHVSRDVELLTGRAPIGLRELVG